MDDHNDDDDDETKHSVNPPVQKTLFRALVANDGCTSAPSLFLRSTARTRA